MRLLASALFVAIVLALGTAAASGATPTTIRAADPEKGKVVVFGCPATPYAKLTGSGSAHRFQPSTGPGAVRSQVFETAASPVTEPGTGTAYREVVVPVVLGFSSGWLPERCFHLAVPEAVVTCVTPVYTDNGTADDGFVMLAESGFTVARGEIVYPPRLLGATGDYDLVNTHRPGVTGLVPHRCLTLAGTSARIPTGTTPVKYRVVPAAAAKPH